MRFTTTRRVLLDLYQNSLITHRSAIAHAGQVHLRDSTNSLARGSEASKSNFMIQDSMSREDCRFKEQDATYRRYRSHHAVHSVSTCRRRRLLTFGIWTWLTPRGHTRGRKRKPHDIFKQLLYLRGTPNELMIPKPILRILDQFDESY